MSPRRTRIVPLLLLGLALPASALAKGERADAAALVERFGSSVVPVRYTLRPQEAPPGGDGQKLEQVVCGVLAGADGTVVIPGDAFPDPGGDPRLTLEPVEFAVLGRDESEHPAQAIGFDRELNLGFLRLAGGIPAGLRPVSFEGDPQIRVGQAVWVLGLLPQRYGYPLAFWPAQVNAAIDKPRRMFSLTTPVQDLSIGGLVVTGDGKVLGLVGEDVLPPQRNPGELPENALSILGSLSQGPRIGYPMLFPGPLFAASLSAPPPPERRPVRSWFGITMQPLSRPLAAYWKIDASGGVIVTSVVDDSPAQAAGLQTGDVLVSLGGAPIAVREDADLAAFRQKIERLPAGEAVPLRVWRAGEPRDVVLRPEAAPPTGFLAEEYRDEDFGLTVREITIDFRQTQNLPVDLLGVVVSELESGGWAEVAGLEPGDLVLRVDELPTPDLAAFRAALDAARVQRTRQAVFFVQRGADTQFVAVRTDW